MRRRQQEGRIVALVAKLFQQLSQIFNSVRMDEARPGLFSNSRHCVSARAPLKNQRPELVHAHEVPQRVGGGQRVVEEDV